MNRLRHSYGFKGPDREGLLKQTMLSSQDKVYSLFTLKNVLTIK